MRRWAGLAGAVLSAALLGGCVSIPDSGPVNTIDVEDDPSVRRPQRVVPPGPHPGDTPEEILTGFFVAMGASPMSASVAREFLTREAAETWNPERGFLVYEGRSTPDAPADTQVTLSGVNRFDSRGAWTGAPSGGQQVLDLGIETEGGQFRIFNVPDRLIVSESWFERETLPYALYFFDPGAGSLVPEPVFLPQGDQLPTLLVRGVLQGPDDSRVAQSSVPSGTTLDPFVTVSSDGVAEVPLSGELATVPDRTVERMAVQLAWTLRQVPGIRSARITVDGQALALPGGATQFSVAQHGASYDPAGIYGRNELYGIRDGLAVRVVDGDVQELAGPFGQAAFGLRDVSVDLTDSRIAGVTAAGDRVLLGAVAGPTAEAPRLLVSGGEDILHPAWDLAGRMWLVDGRRTGAVVSVVQAGRQRAVTVPGVTGLDVIDFLVSRDGTRLVAAIRGRTTDRIVAARILATGPEGRLGASRARAIVSGPGLRIRDLGWRSPFAVHYLRALTGRQSELRSAIVDGSPGEFDPDSVFSASTAVQTRVISSPRPEEQIYLERSTGQIESFALGGTRLPEGLRALTYIG